MSTRRIVGRLHTTFFKTSLLFLVVGVLPILLLGGLFINRYASDARKMMVGSLERSAYYVAQSVENVFSSIDTTISMIYTYSSEGYIHVYDVCEDNALTEIEKSIYFKNMLNEWLRGNSYLSSLRFERNGGFYDVAYADSTKSLRSIQIQPNLLDDEDPSEYVQLQILGTVYEGNFCENSQDYIFTVARNYLDTRSLSTSRTSVLGTIYADVKVDILADIVQKAAVVETSRAYIIDLKRNAYIYSADEADYGKEADWIQEFQSEMTETLGVVYKNAHCLVYAKVGDTDCYVVEYLPDADVSGSVSNTIKYMVFILGVALFVLGGIYILFSDMMSKPVEELKSAMERVQSGNLNVPVSIQTGDEMQYLGDGFNSMQRSLSMYIDQVYKAEISKRDAELNALKLQIQPHYLYNTLDVIRMKALEHDDVETSTLLECLSKQLRYIMGKQSDEVPLVEELNNIRDYFVIIKSRFNGLYELEVDVQDDDLRLNVLKLILQPIVENAVKHGLRQRPGPGKVFIRVQREEEALNIMVMDNGKGIPADKLTELQRKLEAEDDDKAMSGGSVGLKNVYDRIRYQYGPEYGFTITGQENFGTIVTFRLPISE